MHGQIGYRPQFGTLRYSSGHLSQHRQGATNTLLLRPVGEEGADPGKQFTTDAHVDQLAHRHTGITAVENFTVVYGQELSASTILQSGAHAVPTEPGSVTQTCPCGSQTGMSRADQPCPA